MVKKVKKYVKFVVCCALVLSLMAPSYAALSASDGSAFVTKAEFYSALADFNARLTTFEAGINSKIDSQVTSYLDRNGIWSGKDQILVEDHGWFFPCRTLDGKASSDPDGRVWPFKFTANWNGVSKTYTACRKADRAEKTQLGDGSTANTKITANDYGQECVLYYYDFPVVDEISKSGLCRITVSFISASALQGNTGVNARAMLTVGRQTDADTASGDTGVTAVDACAAYFYLNSWVDNSHAVASYKWSEHLPGWNDYCGFTIGYLNSMATLYFFVSSRDKLLLRYKYAGVPTLSRTLTALADKNFKTTTSYPVVGDDGKFYWSRVGSVYNIEECKVY